MATAVSTSLSHRDAPTEVREDEFNGTEGVYLLPHHAEEIKRLQRQHEFIRSATFDRLTSLKLPRNARVLDSGCADGNIGFANSTGHVKLTLKGTWLADLGGFERSPYSLSDLSLHGVDLSGALFRQDIRLDLRQHNLRDPFPKSWGWSNSFDLVHQRLLVWGIGAEEWGTVLDRLIDLLKPGGYIQLVEAEWAFSTYTDEQAQQRKLGLVQCWSTESSGMDVHIWQKLPGLLSERGLVDMKEENFNLGYGATAVRLEDRTWTAELLPQSFRHLARKIPDGGISGVAANAEEYMAFLDDLVHEMKAIGYNPQLKWLTARKPA
ncbi:putative methyltransferase [Myriangium duriaei CBS 260.36]|uniref:Methyltransferase n=1 Tax=Myriangium duriaei CBS 260.36 TaxID=1168546 RepID=A0A9P4IY05_9PEZI|nr:putative methyltransferase [Myriangium duriaei CBS 260.36]